MHHMVLHPVRWLEKIMQYSRLEHIMYAGLQVSRLGSCDVWLRHLDMPWKALDLEEFALHGIMAIFFAIERFRMSK